METTQPDASADDSRSKPGEVDLRVSNTQLQEQAKQLGRINQELVDREQLLRLSIETGRVGVWVWDAAGSIHTLDWSRRLKEIFGLADDAAVTRELFLSCVHAEDRERVDWAIMQSLSGVNDGFYDIEYRIIHPGDGTLHWVTAQGQAFFNASGQSIRFIGAVVDISDRKQVEEFTARLNLELEGRITERTKDLERINLSLSTEVKGRAELEKRLRQSERHLKAAQRLGHAGSFTWFPASGKIVWSEETCRIFEYDPSTEPTLELARQRIHPDDASAFEEQARNATDERRDFSFQQRLLMPDGRIKHVRIITSRASENEIEPIFVGAIMDVTEHKKAEDAFRASVHVTTGHLEALTDTLTSIAQESQPEKYLEHILKAMGRQLRAHSLAICHMGFSFEDITVIAIYENGSFRLADEADQQAHKSSINHLPEHAIWSEFSQGAHCVFCRLEGNQVLLRLDEGANLEWSIWKDRSPEHSHYIERLSSLGVAFALWVPTLVGGKVTGLVSVRFREEREFSSQELELARALANQTMLALQLLRMARESRQAAIIAERNRMARDIHDTLAQGFTGIIAQLQAAKGASDLADAGAHIERAESLARLSLGEARNSVKALRPRSLQEAELTMALGSMLKSAASDSGLQADFVLRGERQPIPPEWEEALLRIVQESLTNTCKHAGAQKFSVILKFAPGYLQLKMIDDGRGFNPGDEHEGFGLIGMKERVIQIGGEFSIHSEPGRGVETVITLHFPASPIITET